MTPPTILVPLSLSLHQNGSAIRSDRLRHPPLMVHEEPGFYTYDGKFIALNGPIERMAEDINTRPHAIDIWMEGYRVTGNASGAQFIGTGYGRNVAEAALELHSRRPIESLSKDGTAIWGCKLFDNEADARKSFG